MLVSTQILHGELVKTQMLGPTRKVYDSADHENLHINKFSGDADASGPVTTVLIYTYSEI